MSINASMKRVPLVGLLVALGALSTFAGAAVVGSVAGSLNATLGGKALEPNTTLFSGDSLAVKDGAAVVALGSGSRMVFGRETQATFLRESDTVTVTLKEGNVSMYHPEAGAAVRVKIGDLVIEPGKGYATEGDVAMLEGSVLVTAKTGTMKVADGKQAKEVKTGQTITIPRAAGGPQGGAQAGGAVAEHTWTLSNGLMLGGLGATGASIGVGIAAKNSADNATTAANNATKAISQVCNEISPALPSCPAP